MSTLSPTPFRRSGAGVKPPSLSPPSKRYHHPDDDDDDDDDDEEEKEPELDLSHLIGYTTSSQSSRPNTASDYDPSDRGSVMLSEMDEFEQSLRSFQTDLDDSGNLSHSNTENGDSGHVNQSEDDEDNNEDYGGEKAGKVMQENMEGSQILQVLADMSSSGGNTKRRSGQLRSSKRSSTASKELQELESSPNSVMVTADLVETDKQKSAPQSPSVGVAEEEQIAKESIRTSAARPRRKKRSKSPHQHRDRGTTKDGKTSRDRHHGSKQDQSAPRSGGGGRRRASTSPRPPSSEDNSQAIRKQRQHRGRGEARGGDKKKSRSTSGQSASTSASPTRSHGRRTRRNDSSPATGRGDNMDASGDRVQQRKAHRNHHHKSKNDMAEIGHHSTPSILGTLDSSESTLQVVRRARLPRNHQRQNPRQRRNTANSHQQAQIRMAASCTGLNFETENAGQDIIIGGARDLDESAMEEKLCDEGDNEEQGQEQCPADGKQKKKKKGVISALKKKFTSSKKDKDKVKSSKNSADTVAGDDMNDNDPEGFLGEETQTETTATTLTTVPDDGNDINITNIGQSQSEEEETGTPRSRARITRRRRRASAGTVGEYAHDDTHHHSRSPRDSNAEDSRSSRVPVAHAGVDRSREFDSAGEETIEDRSKRRQIQREAVVRVQGRRLSGNCSFNTNPSTDDEKLEDESSNALQRRRQKRTESTAASARRQDRAQKRSDSQNAAIEAATRARIRARQKGISLAGENSAIQEEEDDLKRQQRRRHEKAMRSATKLARQRSKEHEEITKYIRGSEEEDDEKRALRRRHDSAMKAAAKLAREKSIAREMVRTLSGAVAQAAAEKFQGSCSDDIPNNKKDSVEPTISNRTAHRGERKAKKGSADSPGIKRQNTPHLSSGDELDPEDHTSLRIGTHQPILPAALRRQLTGEEPAPPLRQKAKPRMSKIDAVPCERQNSPPGNGGDEMEATSKPRLPPNLRRQATGEEPAALLRQRATTAFKNRSTAPSQSKKKPNRVLSEASDIVSESEGSVKEDFNTKVTSSSAVGDEEDKVGRRATVLQFDPTGPHNVTEYPTEKRDRREKGHPRKENVVVWERGVSIRMSKGRTGDSIEKKLEPELNGENEDDVKDDDDVAAQEYDAIKGSGNKSLSRLADAGKWLKKKTKKATKKLLPQAQPEKAVESNDLGQDVRV